MSFKLYATTSGGYVFIGTQEGCIGKVKADTDPVSQFFLKSMGYSMDMQLGKEIFVVNKRSYVKLLHSLGVAEAKIDNLYKYNNFLLAVAECKLEAKEPMRQAIEKVDRLALFRKLAEAISEGKTEEACELACKGAALEYAFFDRGPQPLAFNHVAENLTTEDLCKFAVFEGTPILLAAKKANEAVVLLLKQLGAPLGAVAREYNFSRGVTGGVKHEESSYSPGCTFNALNGLGLSFGTNLRTYKDVNFVDKETDEKKLKLNPDSLILEPQPVLVPNLIIKNL